MPERPCAPAAPIESIRPDDLPAVAALHACCFDEPWRPELIGRIAQAPGGFGLLWRNGGQPLGFVLGRSNGARAEVLSLGVAESARQRGVARALMNAAIEKVGRRGLRTLYLEVAEDNRCRAPPLPGPGLRPGRPPARLLHQAPSRGRGCAHAAPGNCARCGRRGLIPQAGRGAQKRFLIGGVSLPLIARETPSAIAAWQASAISFRDRNCSMVTDSWN